LRISEQGQVTDRYNAAITNLGSRSFDIRLGGIYALQRLMQDSPRDQPTVIAVLCAFVRDRTMSTRKPYKRPPLPPTDIQAALTVVGTRSTADDGPATVVDFGYTQLARAQLDHDNLAHAKLTGVDLTGANLTGADLTYANLAPRTSPARTSPARTSPTRTSPTPSGQRMWQFLRAGYETPTRVA
jgi:hypothetical protein